MNLPVTALPLRARAIARFTNARPEEVPALMLSFGFFFCVLCAYYIVRPIRDETGVAYGTGFLGYAFSIIFLVMLGAVPLIGWLVANLARKRIVPIVYGFFIATLLVFWAIFRFEQSSIYVAGSFYVWVSVFSLFVVSLFWSFMTEVWESDSARRLYGIVSVGGTCGALTGPILVQAFIHHIGVANLLLVSALFLCMALAFYTALRRLVGDHGRTGGSDTPAGGSDTPAGGSDTPAGGLQTPDRASVLAGAINVWKSPYLFRIALWVLAGNFFGLFFTLEQARIFGAALHNQEERILMLSRVENAVSLLTLFFELFVTGRLMQSIGVGRTIAIGPFCASIALIALALFPGVATIATIMVLMRAMDYGLSGPTMRVLYTIVDPADKYRAQNFNDTVIYRGGNVASTWAYNGAVKALGVAGPVMTVIAVPLALCWVWLSIDLGVRHDKGAKNSGTNNKDGLR